MRTNCIRCKGSEPQKYCGRAFCPIIAKSEAAFKVQDVIAGRDFLHATDGVAPTPFVGRYGYPHVKVGILNVSEPERDAMLYDAPRTWAADGYSIPEIVGLRSALVNSRFEASITSVRDPDKFLEASQEVGLSARPVDIEFTLKDTPRFRMNFQPYMAPTGPNAELEDLDLTSNPRIPKQVDAAVGDTGLKAADAVGELFLRGHDENYLSRILSVGTLGLAENRKLVPTRWSITAVDDMVSKRLLEQVKEYREADCQAFFGSYLGNHFLVLLFPREWGYELFETYMPEASWNIGTKMDYTTDWEPYKGRTSYAENCTGGYYAVRLALAEKLKSMRRQASCLVIRTITGEYAVPLGVWVVREAMRKALGSKPLRFGSAEELLEHARTLIKGRFKYDVGMFLQESMLLASMRQRRLQDFFG